MSTKKKIGIGIFGGTGFGAGELLRLLTIHPDASVVSVVSSSSAGKAISSAHPHLRAIYDSPFDANLNRDALNEHENVVIFSALPHGESGSQISKLEGAKLNNLTVIDLSGDLRLKDESLHLQFYPHSPYLKELHSKISYGIPELFKEEIATTPVISNPGCLATSAILALAPLRDCNPLSSISLNMATGSSGSGKEPKASTHHPVRHANFHAYKPLSHQHVPEIEASLTKIGLNNLELAFVPHSLPVSRGILCTAYIHLKDTLSTENLREKYKSFYAHAPFVRVLNDEPCELENVVGSNFCDISIVAKGKTVVVHSAIDNLVKGMAGQAIQNMNIRLGLDETTGLWFPGVRPV